MGLFKKFYNYILESDAKWDREYDQVQKQRWAQQDFEQRRKDATECCANCIWFNQYYQCIKHDFGYDLDDVKYREIHYKKVCNDFYRK